MDTMLKLNDIREIIEKHLVSNSFEIVNFNLIPLSSEVNGFMGEHLKLYIEYTTKSGLHEVQFFAKRCPLSTYTVFTEKAFVKESFFYENIMKHFNESYFRSDKRYDSSFAAKFYFNKEKRLLVLEDITLQGFTTWTGQYFNLDHLYMLAKRTAQLHSGSFLYEEFETRRRGKPYRLIDDYKDELMESMFQGEGPNATWSWFNSCLRCNGILIDKKFGKTESQEFKTKFIKMGKELYKIMKPNLNVRNVVCHGDLWINNAMFLYNDEGKPIDCKLVDFQLIRYAPPAHDVLFPFFITVDRKFRQKHLREYLIYYYKCLTEELAKLDLDIEGLLPLQEFQDTCNYYIPYLVVTKSLYYTVLGIKPEILTEISKTPDGISKFMFESREHITTKLYDEDINYRNFMNDMLDDFYEVIVSSSDKNKIALTKDQENL